MPSRRTLNYASRLLLFGAVAGLVTPVGAQDHPARRLSNIVGVAVDEYAKGIDSTGRMVSEQEYAEAVDFLRDARAVAARLSESRAQRAQALLDTLAAAVNAKRPPSEVARIHQRFVAVLGNEGALELPGRPLDLAAGRLLYQQHCASCHGSRGLGDGPAASGLRPAPPALGDPRVMRDATPALVYRVISVGVSGTAMAGWAQTLTPAQRWNIVAYLHSLRSTPAGVLEGEGLFVQRCVACHGTAGGGDGPAAAALTKLPPEIGSLEWQVERSDAQIAAALRNGIPGTAMPAARDLTDAEVAEVVAYLRAVSVRQREVPTAATGARDPVEMSRRVLSIANQALAAVQAGRATDAADRAFDAYLAFEPLETGARAKSPGLVATMETHFAELKTAARAGDVRAAERSRDAIEAGLPEIVDLTRSPSSPWAAFLQSLLIILREGFEAILVVGAVATFLIKTGNRHRLRAIWLGCAVALAASAVTAVVLQTVLRALPATRELIEGVTMLVAVAVLFSVSYWLISKVEAARWQQFIRDKVQTALAHGGERALALVAFLAVYREGAETALFYQALFTEGRHVAIPLVLGILAGGTLLAAVFVLFHRFGVRIPLRPFFGATSVLLYYLAFVFMGKGIRELQEGNAVSLTLLPHLPEVQAMGIYPTAETLLAQLLLVALFVIALVRSFWPKRSISLPTVPAPPVPAPVLAEHVAHLEARVEVLERILTSEFGTTIGDRPDQRNV